MKKAVLGIDFGTSHSWFTLKYENSQGKTVVTHLNDRVSSNLDSKGIPSLKEEDGNSLKSNLYFAGLTESINQELKEAKKLVKDFFDEIFSSIRMGFPREEELKVLRTYDIDIIVGKPVQYKDCNYVKFIKDIILNSFITSFENNNVKIHVIDEPVLAAHALLKNERIEGNVLVIDIGAGTMDWALLENGNRGYNIIPGGESFDHAGNHFNKGIERDLDNDGIRLSIEEIIEIKEALNLPKEHDKIMTYAGRIASQQYNKNLSELNTDKIDECYNKAYKIYCEKLRRTINNNKCYVVDNNQLGAVPELKEEAINNESIVNILENGTGGSSLFNELLTLTATDIYESNELKKRRGQAGPQKVLLVGGSSNIIELFKYIKHGCVDNLGWENTTYVRIADQKFGEATCANAVAYGACFVPDYVINSYTKKENENFAEGKKAFDKRNYKKALTSFVKVEKEFEGKELLKDDDYAKSLYYIAEIYSEQNKSEEANKYYKKARIAFIKLDDKKMVEKCASKIK